MTSSFSAEQGFTQGANVSVSLKSGANTIHGGLAYYAAGNGSLIEEGAINGPAPETDMQFRNIGMRRLAD
jgi:hypothetical protein